MTEPVSQNPSEYERRKPYLEMVRRRVHDIHWAHPETRESDKRLLMQYMIEYHNAWLDHGVFKIKVDDMLQVDFLTIIRRRQEINEDSDMLPASKAVLEKRGREELAKARLDQWNEQSTSTVPPG